MCHGFFAIGFTVYFIEVQNQLHTKFAGIPVEFYQYATMTQKLNLDEKPLDLVLQGTDLPLQLGRLVGGDGRRDDSAGNTTGTPKGNLGGDKDVGDVLVFAEEWKVEEDLEGGGVGGENNEFGNTAVERFGRWEACVREKMGWWGWEMYLHWHPSSAGGSETPVG